MLRLDDPKVVHDLALLFAQEQFRLMAEAGKADKGNIKDNALMLAGFYINAKEVYETAIRESKV